MSRPPNLIIRDVFKRAFASQRHIKVSVLLDWFANDPRLSGFTEEERINAINFLKVDGRIVAQSDTIVWNSYGPRKNKGCSSVDADSVGNLPGSRHGHTGANNMWLSISHPRY